MMIKSIWLFLYVLAGIAMDIYTSDCLSDNKDCLSDNKRENSFDDTIKAIITILFWPILFSIGVFIVIFTFLDYIYGKMKNAEK